MTTVVSLDGTIAIKTTDQGLPLAVRIDPGELAGRDPAELARKVLRLCRSAADRAALAMRAELESQGARGDVIALLGLPTADEVARREHLDEIERGVEPASWVRRR
jgi:hypothetical protein